MRNRIIVVIVVLMAAAAFSSEGWAQRGQGGGGQGAQGGQGRGGANAQNADGPREAGRRFGNDQALASVPFPPGWKPCPRCQNDADRARDNQANKTAGHAFNPHDLTGTWGWDGVGQAFRDAKGAPPLTPEGKALFAETIGIKAPDGTALHSKDTSGRGNSAAINCDPYGWPRLFQYNYGFAFEMAPDHITQFFELNHTFRTIWTDGRKLPDEIPSDRFMGWNVGHWEGDTLVIESTGYDDRTWLSQANPDGGWIHSSEMKVVERWHRTQYGKIEAEITVTDPKIYTGPWTVKGAEFLVPGAELGEEFCVPSDYRDFNEEVFGRAANGDKKK